MPPKTPNRSKRTLKSLIVQVMFAFVLCLMGPETTFATQSVYPEQTCLKQLRNADYPQAIQCMKALYRKSRRSKHLYFLSLFYEKAGRHWIEKNPVKACRRLDLAVKGFRQLESEAPARKRSQLKERLRSLVGKLRYASIKLTTQPRVARLSLRGSGVLIRKKGTLIAKLCPGQYQLSIRAKGFRPRNLTLRLAPKQRLRRLHTLQLAPRRPFQMPVWGSTMLVGAGLGLLGGAFYIAAEFQLQELDRQIDLKTGWKSHMSNVQVLSSIAVGCFVGGGILVGVAVGMFVFKRSRPPPPKAVLAPQRTASSFLETGVSLWRPGSQRGDSSSLPSDATLLYGVGKTR